MLLQFLCFHVIVCNGESQRNREREWFQGMCFFGMSLFTPHSFCCRCALNTGQISWSINVVTVALWLCSSALGRLIFATPVMMISRGWPVSQKKSCLIVLLVQDLNAWIKKVFLARISFVSCWNRPLFHFKLLLKLLKPTTCWLQFLSSLTGPKGKQLEGSECPLHVVHPPTGEEFALGCGVCRNAHTF